MSYDNQVQMKKVSQFDLPFSFGSPVSSPKKVKTL